MKINKIQKFSKISEYFQIVLGKVLYMERFFEPFAKLFLSFWFEERLKNFWLRKKRSKDLETLAGRFMKIFFIRKLSFWKVFERLQIDVHNV